MSCNIDAEIIRAYPSQFDLLFISTSGDAISNTYIGFIEELEKVANATSTPETKVMKSVRSSRDLLNKPIFIQSIEFFPYDTTLIGGSGQDDLVTTEIINSKSGNSIYPQSDYLSAMMPLNWQPNYFNFSFFVNGTQVIEGLDNPNDLSIADMTIGQPLPYCIEIMKEVPRFKNFKLTSRYAQYVRGEEKYQNYPLLAKVSIRIGRGY